MASNRTLFALVLAVHALWLTPPIPAAAAAPWALAATGSVADMIDEVLPTVVNVSTETVVDVRSNPLITDPFFRRFFDIPERPRQRKGHSLGSGVIVDAPNGYILTNHHVVEGAREITVTLRDQRTYPGRVIGVDPDTDLALLQIEAENLKALPMADSDRIRVGDFVVAVGNPFGLGQTVTSGIVSAIGRSGLGIEGYEEFIQTDASINPGNSGGPLVNMAGELVGINTAIVGPTGGNVGIGFAIPANMAKAVVAQLAEYGEVRRGQLGVSVQDVTPQLAKAFGLERVGGALIAAVVAGSPAERAGLRRGDVVTAVNDKPVRSADQLRNAVGMLPIGAPVALAVIRNGRPQQLTATLGTPADLRAMSDDGRTNLAGAVLGEIEADHALRGRIRGVQVLAVEPESIAARAGIQPGDIIVSINRRDVGSVAEIAAAAARSPDRLLLNIQRGTTALFLVLR